MTDQTEPVSPAYARLQAAAKEATEAAHLHAMHGMRRTYQLCIRWGHTPIPPSEVLNALGLDENANTVDPDPAAGPPASAATPPADQAAELERLRTENERMRHELEDMYGGAFDSLDTPPPTDQTAPSHRAGLLEQIAAEIWAQYPDAEPSPAGLVMANPHALAAVTLAVLYREWPWLRAEAEDATPPADRAAIRAEAFREAAVATRRGAFADTFDRMADAELRRLADEAQQQPDDRGPWGTRPRCNCPHAADEHSVYGCLDGCACEWMPKPKPKPTPMNPWRILGIADCPTPKSHNWGCGCPTDQLPLHAESGVDTPGCDCGHDGMGPKWHAKACAWTATLNVPHPDAVADEAPEPEPSVHGESVAHLAGDHDDEPAVDARQDGAQQ